MSAPLLEGADPQFVKVLELLRSQRPALVSFLDVARVKVEGAVLTVAFDQMFYVDALREPANDKAIREAIRTVLGDAGTLVVHGPEQGGGGGTSLSDLRAEERRKREAERLARIQQHPAVKAAQDIFGARIREVKAPGETA